MSKPRPLPCRLIIADDRPGVRQALRQSLPLAGSLEIVGEAVDGEGAIELAGRLAPDAVLLDLEMASPDGLATAARLRQLYPACRIVVLTMNGDPTIRGRASQAGVDALVVKGAPLEAIVSALRSGGEQKGV
jgi:two-component system response regulator DesR